MFNEINPINSGTSSIRGTENNFQYSGARIFETPLMRSFDMVDVESTEQGEESESSNLQALRNSFSLNQGFEQGVQPSFAMNSSSGVTDGLEPGIHPAGIFKSPQE